ncbi:hypothetical protein [Pseudonocardia sp. GCM10023141]|uniref:hypothetical protein n=1 Tax=Pseudonocardia sp. GCM10023141 TaxID=3252653 RepID=UPI003607F7B3
MLRLVLSPRWIMWHLLTLGAMATCAWLAVWQWQRAGSAMGSALNVGYGLQWPLFALFFAGMWWRMLRMEIRQVTAGPDGVDAGLEPAAEVVPDAAEPVAVEPAPEPRPAATGPSPFGPRPASTRPVITDEDDPELAAYNRMLALLAARYPDD